MRRWKSIELARLRKWCLAVCGFCLMLLLEWMPCRTFDELWLLPVKARLVERFMLRRPVKSWWLLFTVVVIDWFLAEFAVVGELLFVGGLLSAFWFWFGDPKLLNSCTCGLLTACWLLPTIVGTTFVLVIGTFGCNCESVQRLLRRWFGEPFEFAFWCACCCCWIKAADAWLLVGNDWWIWDEEVIVACEQVLATLQIASWFLHDPFRV